jgi:Histidine kinase-, DNA gyrase B-, and HSP90-like ATPase
MRPSRTGAAIDVTPSASRLTSSLRDIGYDFASAVADIVDNSVSAGARHVEITVAFAGVNSFVLISDDGRGMSEGELNEALRFGTRQTYADNDLGRYGLGLKTASLSQCRRLTVLTRTSPQRVRVRMRTLDLGHILGTDRWEVLDGPPDQRGPWADAVTDHLRRGPGTVVAWDILDRVLPDRNPQGGWARRRLESLRRRLHDHLGMVFHRFLEGTVPDRDRLVISVNGEKIRPWNPFAPAETARIALPERSIEVWSGELHGTVAYRPYVLPARSLFSSQAEFERYSGPKKWNRQQGLYIYRADRLIQSGGWNGIRAIDEHTKLGRAALDFSPDLDELFQINVAKMRVSVPTEVRTLLEPEVTNLCHRAQAMYRRESRDGAGPRGSAPASHPRNSSRVPDDCTAVGLSLLAAAMATGTGDALEEIIAHLEVNEPEVLRLIGLAPD